MHHPTTTGRWRPLILLTCNALAILLVASWYLPAMQQLWAPLDAWTFYTLNGSLADGQAWQQFWAAVNTRQFDVVSALLILGLYSVHLFGGGSRERVVERATAGLVMLLCVVAALQVSKYLLDQGRMSPSVALEPSILLGDIITGFDFSDRSDHSFPGDRGIALIMLTTFIWYYAGRSYGLIMVLASLLLMLPRLVVGAHWLTDNLVGAVYVSLIVLSWVLATPLHAWLHRRLRPLMDAGLRLTERALAFLGGGEQAVRKELPGAPRTLVKGFCMGSADIVPGVSGGTMALILGIYERLLRAIRSFDRDWLMQLLRLRVADALARNDLLFLAPLGLGIVFALLFFTRIVPLPVLIHTHPEMVYGLFFGLILASILVLMGEVDRYGPTEVLTTLIGVVAGFAIVNLVPMETPTAPWFIFLCGFVAISAMLLPGISGSFILLILGKYAYILNALGTLDLMVILTFVAGIIAGLVVFSRTIVWLLGRYRQATLLVIKGILIGSLWIIWPFQERVFETVRGKERLIGSSPVLPERFDATVAAALGLLLTGFLLVMIVHRLAVRPPPAPDTEGRFR